MTPQDLQRKAEEAIKRGDNEIALVIPGIRNGKRARVLPGLMGEVVSWTARETVVMVDAEKVLAVLKKGV